MIRFACVPCALAALLWVPRQALPPAALPAGWSETTVHGFTVRTKDAFAASPAHGAVQAVLAHQLFAVARAVPDASRAMTKAHVPSSSGRITGAMPPLERDYSES